MSSNDFNPVFDACVLQTAQVGMMQGRAERERKNKNGENGDITLDMEEQYLSHCKCGKQQD